MKILDLCAVLELQDVNPKFLKVGELRLGERDHFHLLGNEGGKWFFYRRIRNELNLEERELLQEHASRMGMGLVLEGATNIIKMAIPEPQGKFYSDINKIAGCRISPITFQRSGSVFISIEFPSTRRTEISDLVMDYISGDLPFKRRLVYVGPSRGNLPYLLNMYSATGNSLGDLILVKTQWAFSGDEKGSEVGGIFQNKGILVPKQFVIGGTDELIWKLESTDIMGNVAQEVVDEKNGIVEMKVTSRYFSDFYRNLVKNYCGVSFFGIRCENEMLVNYFIVEKHTIQDFLRGLYMQWSSEARKNHHNYLVEVRNLASRGGLNDFPF